MNPLLYRSFALLILLLSNAISAEVYRCGAHCYTDNPQFSGSPATLTQLGSYTENVAQNPNKRSNGQNGQSTKRSSHKQTEANTENTRSNRQSKTRRSNTNSSNTHQAATPINSKLPASPSRHEILRGELNNEQNALAQAQQKLTAAKRNGNNSEIGRLQTEIGERRHNIQALQQELNRR